MIYAGLAHYSNHKFANSEEAMFDRLATVPLNENYSIEPQQTVLVSWRCCAIEALQKKFTACTKFISNQPYCDRTVAA